MSKKQASEFDGLELAIGVVTGARSFKVDKIGRLTGITYPQVWKPGENLAECRKSPESSYAGLSYSLPMSSSIIEVGGNQYMIRGQDPITGDYDAEDRMGNRVVLSAAMLRQYSSYSISSPSYQLGGYVPITAAKPKKIEPHTLDSCSCGFYGYYDGSNDYYKEGYVSGVVEAYGETMIGTRGFRASKARIVALFIPETVEVKFGRMIARNYADVPIFSRFLDMVSEFPPDGGENVSPASPTDEDFWTRTI